MIVFVKATKENMAEKPSYSGRLRARRGVTVFLQTEGRVGRFSAVIDL